MRRRRIGFALVSSLLALTGTGSAQEASRVSVAGGYSYLKELNTGDLPATAYEAGWVATGGVRFGASRFSAIGEIGNSTHLTQFQERQQLFGVFGGVRFDLFRWAGATVYAQGLAGRERFSEPGYSVWGISTQPGGGADIRLWSNVFARVQADYRLSTQDGDRFHAMRWFAGGGVAFGGR